MLVVRAAARLEIEEAAEWYEGREPGLGSAFVEAVEAIFNRIERSTSGSRTGVHRSRASRTT